jgi:hypothetical protein
MKLEILTSNKKGTDLKMKTSQNQLDTKVQLEVNLVNALIAYAKSNKSAIAIDSKYKHTKKFKAVMNSKAGK